MSQHNDDRVYRSPFAGVTGLDLLEQDKQKRRERELGRKIYQEYEKMMREASVSACVETQKEVKVETDPMFDGYNPNELHKKFMKHVIDHEKKTPGKLTMEVIEQAIEAGSRKLDASWCVEVDPEKPEDFTVTGVSLVETKEETDEEKYDRVMADLMEDPLK